GLAALSTVLRGLRVIARGVVEVGLLRRGHGIDGGLISGSGGGPLVPDRVNFTGVLLGDEVAGRAVGLTTGVDVDPVVGQLVVLHRLVALLVAEVAGLLEGTFVLAVLVISLELGLRVAGVAQLGVHLGAVHLVGALPAVGAGLGEGGVRHGSHLSVGIR